MDRQYVGIDLRRRRSVIVRMNAVGDVLGEVRIDNDPSASRYRSPQPDGRHPDYNKHCEQLSALLSGQAFGKLNTG